MVGNYVDFGIKTDRRSLDVTDLKEVLNTCRKYQPQVILHLVPNPMLTDASAIPNMPIP